MDELASRGRRGSASLEDTPEPHAALSCTDTTPASRPFVHRIPASYLPLSSGSAVLSTRTPSPQRCSPTGAQSPPYLPLPPKTPCESPFRYRPPVRLRESSGGYSVLETLYTDHHPQRRDSMRIMTILVLGMVMAGCDSSPTGPTARELEPRTYLVTVARSGTGTPSWGGSVDVVDTGETETGGLSFEWSVPGFAAGPNPGFWSGSSWEVKVMTSANPPRLVLLRITRTSCSAALDIGIFSGIAGDCALVGRAIDRRNR